MVGTCPRGRRRIRRADSAEAAEAAIADAYLPNRVFPLDDRPFEFTLASLQLDAATVGLVGFDAKTRVDTSEAANYHVNLPVRGEAVSQSGGGDETRAVPGVATVFMPDRPADIVWGEGCLQMCLMIPESMLVEELEQLLGRTVAQSLVFESEMDLSTPMARGWRASLEVLRTELVEGPALASQLRVARQLERLMIDGLLLGQRHNYSQALEQGVRRPSSTSITRARALLEERPSEPWSTSSLAARVHLSVRSLQEGFARDYGMPPMAYLQMVRLRRARDLLREGSPNETTVAKVASDLGLSHLGRFAAAYRREFGELPSETLRRD